MECQSELHTKLVLLIKFDTQNILILLNAPGALHFAKGGITVDLKWLEHLWNHENSFETGVVQAKESEP